MKRINFVVCCILVSFSIISCEKDSDYNKNPEIRYVLQEEYNTDGENEINISFEASTSLYIMNPNLAVGVYGYDKTLADAPATLITRQYLQLSKIPNSSKIKLPKDSYKIILPESTKENSKFYLSIEWDSDNNEEICTGDITFDYDKKFPSVDLETKSMQSVFMKLIPSTTPCN